MAIPTVPMRLGKYTKQYSLQNVTGLPNFFDGILAQYSGHYLLEAAVSSIRMKFAVKDSVYLFSPMKVVAFGYLV